MATARDSLPEARFNKMYEEHFEAVRRYVWRRDPGVADDVVAETFLVAWRRLDDVPAQSLPWLIGVARHARLNHRRGDRRQAAVGQRLAGIHSADVDDRAPLGDEEVLSDTIGLALARLSERDREVLLLSAWEDLDRAGIARVLGCSMANASVRLHRARRRFVAEMQRLGPDGPPSEPTSTISATAGPQLTAAANPGGFHAK